MTERYTCSKCRSDLNAVRYCPECGVDPMERMRKMENALRELQEVAGEVFVAIYAGQSLGCCTECVVKLHVADIKARAFEGIL